jgi:hypothetical protein
MMDLGELPFGRYEFAVWAGGHVTAGQHAGKDVRRGSELEARTSESPRSSASTMAQE